MTLIMLVMMTLVSTLMCLLDEKGVIDLSESMRVVMFNSMVTTTCTLIIIKHIGIAV